MIYTSNGFIVKDLIHVPESKKYAACSFRINSSNIQFRVAHITPKKIGQFVFPKEVLCEKGIISKNSRGGKRAVRIYPPWDQPKSQQAKNTQAWQLNYFSEIT